MSNNEVLKTSCNNIKKFYNTLIMSELDPFVMKGVVKGDAYIDPVATHVIKDPLHVPLMHDSPQPHPFNKSSPLHGRSFEDSESHIFTGEPITDEYGNVYSSFSIKGADCSYPRLGYRSIDPNYVMVEGMLDASTFNRCWQVSVALREKGVLTEWPIAHMRPKEFPNDKKNTNLATFRNEIYNDFVIEQEALRSNLATTGLAESIGIVGLLGQSLQDIEFGVMYRAMRSNVRLWEIPEHLTNATLGGHLESAIKALQLGDQSYLWNWGEIKALDPKSDLDQQKYLLKVLPALMGENQARFHNADCYHKYLDSGGNWTLAGEIVDLDSVTSPGIFEDDRSVGINARLYEVFNTCSIFESIAIMMTGYDSSDRLPVAGGMWREFIRSYFATRIEKLDPGSTEALVVDSYIPQPDALQDMDSPRIVDIRDIAAQSLFVKMALKIAEVDFNASNIKLERDLNGMLREFIAPRLDERLEADGVDQSAYWLYKNEMINAETKKLMAYFILTVQSAYQVA